MLTVQDIPLTQTKPKRIKEWGFSYQQIEQDISYSGPHIVGIDPGVNWGVTCLGDNIMYVLWGKLPGGKQLPGMRGVQAAELVKVLDLGADLSVVEGAAYHSKFGQVALEEVRFGLFFGLYKYGSHPVIIPPATIKAKILGSGRAQAGDVWPWLNHNAADSISIALYGQYIQLCGHSIDSIISSEEGTHYCKECEAENNGK